MGKKLTQQVKWLPYTQRFQIWMESRHLIADFKEQSSNRLACLTEKISNAIGTILEKDLNI
jgi:hypothetical protein